MRDLNPCPFCGAEECHEAVSLPLTTHPGVWFVQCNDCGARGPAVVASCAIEAINLWNDRAEVTP